MSEPSPFSDAALARQAAVDAKSARGEAISWSDLRGLLEPNPDLPDCQRWEGDYQCDLPNHHEGPHRHLIEWGGDRTVGGDHPHYPEIRRGCPCHTREGESE